MYCQRPVSIPASPVIRDWFDLEAGLYLLCQESPAKRGVLHYAVLDIGNRLAVSTYHRLSPTIIHRTPLGFEPIGSRIRARGHCSAR
jgi:hypothetical protein